MPLSARFNEALIYACTLHADQVRKSTDVPYVAHLLSVAALVLEHGGSEDEAIAALLHDAIEDQPDKTSRSEIEVRFGRRVREIVESCTDADQHPKPPWRARKEAYIAHVTSASNSVRLVVAADKLHNTRALVADYRLHGESLWDRFSGGRQGTLWYYRAVIDALHANSADLPPHLERLFVELHRSVTQLERLADGAGD